MMREKIKAAAVKVASWTPDVLMVVGAASVSYGSGLVYMPAGFIVAGILAAGAGYLIAKGGK